MVGLQSTYYSTQGSPLVTYYYSTCNECKTHGVELFPLHKHGGGNYRRPGRTYPASVCR